MSKKLTLTAFLKSAGILALLPFAVMSAAEACSGTPEAPDAGDAGPFDAGTLYLSSLEVWSASGSSSVVLTPQFSPDIYDYSVRCAAGDNALMVSMKPSPGAESLLLEPTASPATPDAQQLSVTVAEGKAIVAEAKQGNATVEYWVRCLPHDFPPIQWSEHPEAGARTPGYYLIGTAVTPSPNFSYAFVLDNHGVPVWFNQEANGGIIDVDNLVDGSVSLFTRSQPLPHKFELRHLSPLSTSYPYYGQQTDEHEIQYLADSGTFIAFSTEVIAGVDLTGVQIPLPDAGIETLNGRQAIIACDIVEFTADHKKVWYWKALDHLDPRQDTTWPQIQGLGPDGGPAYNVFHCNSIDVDPANGNLLVSSRHMDSVFYIDKATGKIVWKMGGNSPTLDNAAYVTVLSPFFRQHDARLHGWTETCTGAKGQLSVFDDETAKPANARGVLYDVTIGTPDGATSHCDGGYSAGKSGQATVAWEYADHGASSEVGSFRIYDDGGTRIIGWGGTGAGLGFSEVNLAKHDLLDMNFGPGFETYRAIKVPLGAYSLDALRHTSGLP